MDTESSKQLAAAFRRCLPAAALADLDDPSFDFLLSIVREEVAFVAECPGSLTPPQLAHILALQLHEPLVSFEVAKDAEEAAGLCSAIVAALQRDNIVELSAGDASADSSSPVASPSAAPPRLSAPLRLTDLAQSQAEKEASLELSMAALYRASVRWTPDEEVNLFQSLADTPAQPDADGAESDEEEMEGGCEMCRRSMPLTKHHVIPRAMHKRSPYSSLGADVLSRCIRICRPCHSALHRMEDEKTLAEKFRTLEQILDDERMQRWVKYIAKQRVNRTDADNRTGKVLHYAR